MSKAGDKRAFISHSAFYFVDRDRKWHRLCAVEAEEGLQLLSSKLGETG